MFSGIIKTISKIEKQEEKNKSLFLSISKPKKWKIKAGDSICTDGACLTVKKVNKETYITELMPETLNKTYFNKNNYKYVNLEKSLKLNDLLDGHLVTGHIDAIGKIEKISKQGNSKIYQISFPNKFTKYVADKGSISVDGISLTVVECKKNKFTISLVDFTLKNTTIGQKKVNDLVHLEFDIIAKYLDKIYANR